MHYLQCTICYMISCSVSVTKYANAMVVMMHHFLCVFLVIFQELAH